ncbi:uncharacterized protein LOC144053206 [Vanacampus margaritifer]
MGCLSSNRKRGAPRKTSITLEFTPEDNFGTPEEAGVLGENTEHKHIEAGGTQTQNFTTVLTSNAHPCPEPCAAGINTPKRLCRNSPFWIRLACCHGEADIEPTNGRRRCRKRASCQITQDVQKAGRCQFLNMAARLGEDPEPLSSDTLSQKHYQGETLIQKHPHQLPVRFPYYPVQAKRTLNAQAAAFKTVPRMRRLDNIKRGRPSILHARWWSLV